MKSYQKGKKKIDYLIVRKSIKNTYFRVKNNHINITSNHKISEKVIREYLDSKFEVFYEKLNHIRIQEQNSLISLWGREYYIKYELGKFGYYFVDQTIFVKSNLESQQKTKQQIYQSELKKELIMILPTVESKIREKGVLPVPIKLKYLRSKFGSYHKKHKEITLNTFLATVKPIYLEYVIYHEYAHALVFDHSKDFYAVLAYFMTDYRLYQKDLKSMAII